MTRSAATHCPHCWRDWLWESSDANDVRQIIGGRACAISIRTKILAIVLGFFTLVVAAFIVYSVSTTENYRQLRTEEVSKTVAFESERVGKIIAEMERNAIDLALSGQQYYRAGDHSVDLGAAIATENFAAFPTAVGGGIWFEPYAINANARRACYYAFFDPLAGGVRYDPDFESAEYDYHTQGWYTHIAANVTGKYHTVWTAPYIDASGTFSLMTTVGAGIYGDDGRFLGMSTVDWEIQDVVDSLSAIKPTSGSFALLASPHDDFILSNTHERGADHVGSSLSTLPWYGELHFSDADRVDIGRFTLDAVEYISFSRLFDNGWLFSIQIPAVEIFEEIEARNNQFTGIIGISSIVLLALAFYLVSRLINRPLRKLTADVAELGGGNLDKQIQIDSTDEIGALASAFNKMTLDLKASIEQSARERAEKERIGAELNVATRIQASMLPCIFPAFPERPEFDIYANMLPAKEVGGDFYDFFLIDDQKLAVVIADVSGKGVPAALFMVIAKTLIKNNAQYGKTPKQVFETVNNLLCENNEAGMFVTAFMGYLDIPSGAFSYVNAGHNPPLLKRAGGQFEWLPTKPGFVLAGMEDMVYKQDEITLAPGDTVFLYTDGVTEAVDREDQLFSDPRLLEVANVYKDCELEELLVSIKREIDAFADGAEQADDITMLTLKISGGTT